MSKYSTEKLCIEIGSPKTLGRALRSLSRNGPSKLKLYHKEISQLMDLILAHKNASDIPKKYVQSAFEYSMIHNNFELYQKLSNTSFSKIISSKTLGRALRSLSLNGPTKLKLYGKEINQLTHLVLAHKDAPSISKNHVRAAFKNSAAQNNLELYQKLNNTSFSKVIPSKILGQSLRSLSRNGATPLKLYGKEISQLLDLILAHKNFARIPTKYIQAAFENSMIHNNLELYQKLSHSALSKKISDKNIAAALKLSWHLRDPSGSLYEKYISFTSKHPYSLFNLLFSALRKNDLSAFQQNIIFFSKIKLKNIHIAALICLCDALKFPEQKKILDKHYKVTNVAKKHYFPLIIADILDVPICRFFSYQNRMIFSLCYLALKGSTSYFEQLQRVSFFSFFKQSDLLLAEQVAEIAGNHDVREKLTPLIQSRATISKKNEKQLKTVISRTIKKIDRIELKQLPLKFIPKLLYLAGFRFIRFEDFKGIGHLATEPPCALQEKKMGLLPYKLILLFTNPTDINNNNNSSLLQLWKKYFFSFVFEKPQNTWQSFIKKIFYAHFLKNAEHYEAFHYKTDHYLITGMYPPFSSARIFEMNNITHPPILRLPKKALSNGNKILEQLGLPKGAWFVPFHARDPSFLQNVDPKFENNYTHRNVNVDDYSLALEAIIKRGGWCIRIGSQKTIPLSKKLISLGKVIDYPHSPFVSDAMDIFLLSQGRFCLCCNSGPATVPSVFNKPIVKVQVSPIWSLAYRDHDLIIPKLNYLKKEKRLATFEEMTGVYVSRSHDKSFAENQIDVIDNTPEEIRDVTVEMLDILDKTASYSEEDKKRQELFNRCKHKGMYTYKSPAKIGKTFLKKYSYLLTQDKPHV